MDFFRFLFNKSFLKQLGFLVLAFIILFVILVIGLQKYTRHGEVIKTPNVVGLQGPEAVRLLKSKGLKCEVVDSIFSERAKPGAIIEQNPAEAAEVKRNRAITVVINPVSIPNCILPDLTSTSLRQGRMILEASGFSLGKLIYVYSDYRDLIVGMEANGSEVEAGASFKKNTVIDLVVGKGPGDTEVHVPNLVNMDLDQVKEMLQQASLSLGAVLYDSATTSDMSPLKVYQQYPAGKDAMVYMGKSINVWLTSDLDKVEKIVVADSMANSVDSLSGDAVQMDESGIASDTVQ